MPSYLLKLDKEHDAFAMFSTIVDGFVTGPLDREQAFKTLLERRGGPLEMVEAAIVRAEISGSSSKDGDYAWDDGGVLILDGGACKKTVPRDKLYDHVMAEQRKEKQ